MCNTSEIRILNSDLILSGHIATFCKWWDIGRNCSLEHLVSLSTNNTVITFISYYGNHSNIIKAAHQYRHYCMYYTKAPKSNNWNMLKLLLFSHHLDRHQLEYNLNHFQLSRSFQRTQVIL